MTTEQTQIITRKPRRLTDPLFQLALAWVSAVLVGWPLIQIAGAHGTLAVFVYVFVVWSGLVVVLLAVSRNLQRSAPPKSSNDGRTSERTGEH